MCIMYIHVYMHIMCEECTFSCWTYFLYPLCSKKFSRSVVFNDVLWYLLRLTVYKVRTGFCFVYYFVIKTFLKNHIFFSNSTAGWDHRTNASWQFISINYFISCIFLIRVYFYKNKYIYLYYIVTNINTMLYNRKCC